MGELISGGGLYPEGWVINGIKTFRNELITKFVSIINATMLIAQNAATHPGLSHPFSREHLKAHHRKYTK